LAFEIVEPGTFNFAEPLAVGQCSISKAGRLSCRAEDVRAVGIGHYAIVMADGQTMRVALRVPRDGEQPKSAALTITTAGKGAKKHDAGRRNVLIMRALRRLGVTPEAVAGRYALSQHDGSLLIVCLTGERIAAGEVQRIARARDGGRAKHQSGERGRTSAAHSVGGLHERRAPCP
jgi:hypothetical protein